MLSFNTSSQTVMIGSPQSQVGINNFLQTDGKTNHKHNFPCTKNQYHKTESYRERIHSSQRHQLQFHWSVAGSEDVYQSIFSHLGWSHARTL